MTDGKKTGIVFGKFCPVHAGHQYLLDFAGSFVDELFIVLICQASDPVGEKTRSEWLAALAPRAHVRPVMIGESDDPDERRLVLSALDLLAEGPSALPPSIDFVFGSESYGFEIAQIIGAVFVPVDPPRGMVATSGAQVRNDPLAHWDNLPECVRPFYVKRVCVFGPESTGKSTLTINLARHFGTVAVPEYARVHIDSRNNELSQADLAIFARGQIASEDAMARKANRVLFCDTDAITTSIWSEWLYGSCDQSIRVLADARTYDLYLLTDVDVPWVSDPQRYLPEKRKQFFEHCRQELAKRDRPYAVISGNWDERLTSAIAAVEKMMKKTPAGH